MQDLFDNHTTGQVKSCLRMANCFTELVREEPLKHWYLSLYVYNRNDTLERSENILG